MDGKRKRGRPPKDFKLSGGEKELLDAGISHAREAIDLLAACEACPVLEKIKKADSLLYEAHKEIAGIINHDDGLEDLLEELDAFVEKKVEFSKNAWETVRNVYDDYVSFFGITENEVNSRMAFSRHRFSRMMLKKYGNLIDDTVKWVNGKPERCFVGLRLKKEEDAENGG
jgi:hypothetical protein